MSRCGCADGVCRCRVVAHPDGSTTVTGAGSETNPYVVQANPSVEVQDTATVDMSISGDGTPTNPFVLSAEVDAMVDEGCGIEVQGSTVSARVDPDPCNDLECRPDGLFVPQRFEYTDRRQMDAAWRWNGVAFDWPPPDDQRYIVTNGVRVTPGDAATDGADMGTHTNPDPCCPMLFTIYPYAVQQDFNLNGDLCGAAAAFFGAGGGQSGGVRFTLGHRLLINGGNLGVTQRNSYAVHPDAGIAGCGVDVLSDQDVHEPAYTVLVPPGGNFTLSAWAEIQVGSTEGGAVADPQRQALYDFLVNAAGPSVVRPRMGQLRIIVEGRSVCDDVSVINDVTVDLT